MPEGIVICFAEQFQVCASGVRSVKMLLAQGTTCNIFSGSSTGSTDSSAPPAASCNSSTKVYVPAYQAHLSQSTKITTRSAGAVPSTSSSGSLTFSSSQPVPSRSYSGPASNFPSQSLWISFDLLWNLNKDVCELNLDGMAQLIHDDILQIASESGVDERVIFTVVLQESTCLLSAPTMNNSINNRQISPEYPFFFFLSGEYPFLAVYRGSTPPLLYQGITPPPNIRPHCRCRQSTKPYSKSISGEYLPPDKTPLSLPLVHEACTSSKNISGEYPPPSTLDPAVAAASPQSLCF